MRRYEYKVKKYITPSNLKEYFPNNEVVYTIDSYSSIRRSWEDSVITVSSTFETNWDEYSKIMRSNFNCVLKEMKLYYGSYDECKRAIELSKSLIIMNRLLK